MQNCRMHCELLVRISMCFYFVKRSVLYNLGNDYERALDCLRAALSLRPEVLSKKAQKHFFKDPMLWNRFGATLANADRSAEAINAYKRALQLSPSYVRARYNLGTACMNLNSYRQEKHKN